MKIDNTNMISQKVKEEIKTVLAGENKEEAITEAMEMAIANYNEELISNIVAEANEADANKENKARLGLRTLSKEENKFYDMLKAKQAITADQIDIIPTSIIDNTMNEVKAASPVLGLVNFAPADVKKWLVAEKSGTYSWGSLTAALGTELSTTFTALNVELGKLSVVLVIPKAIRELSNEYVDKYFMAILNETFNDGLEYGFIQGNGKDQPIGIMNQINKSTSGVHAAKTLTVMTGFTPKEMAAARKTLSHGGVRVVDRIALICNPADRVTYVDPALLNQTSAGGYVQVSPLPIDVMECANCPEGKAVLTIAGKYTMAYSGLEVKEYDQTKALDDADVLVAKAYANGRATDDDTAVVVDATKLVEFKPVVVTETKTAA